MKNYHPEQLKKIMEDKGITLKDLAQHIDSTPVHIHRIYTKKRIPSLVLAFRIADAIGLSVEEIFRKKNGGES